ncbi:VOC family protein [Mycobacterium sp. UM_Kg1]|uniref:VOC family protein n=1 Tax=Mycobacterium sp. UM_Kg1 TaxID=1545691 RepID=UPI00061ACD15|nr:VOC family protein [Mycobacterium sp. UM_Kg1]
MSTAKIGLKSINLVCVPTVDQDKAIAFYESLGFEKRTDIHMGDGYRWVEVYPPQGLAGIALAPPPPDSGSVEPADTGITLNTDDIDAAHAGMRELGVDVDAEIMRQGDPVPPMFFFRDPSGHSLLMVEA